MFVCASFLTGVPDCMHSYVGVCVHECVRTCLHAYVNVCVHVCMHAYAWVLAC